MNEPLHSQFLHYSELPYSVRVLYTAALLVLGLGYLFAIIYLFHTYSGKDGNPMTLTYDDLVIAYTGSGKGSRLESALSGAMSTMLPPDERTTVVKWVQQGADQPTYEKEIRPTLDKRCMSCHDGSNPHLPNLSGFDNMKKVTERDTGTDIFTLVRVSHIHLFGLTFIFFIMGMVFSHAYIRPVWLKCTLVAIPFLFLATDVISWYMVKVFHPFAWITMAAGALMGLCFASMWCIAMYQIWFSATPKAVVSRESRQPTLVG
jgi:S-100/ICaBP type calcium binding domain-containing protein